MDFPVEATVCLDVFRDALKVRELLWSHDFEVRDLNRNQVRVKGSFSKLRAVKGLLELLQHAESKMETSPWHSNSGAVPKYSSGSGGHRGRLESGNGSPHGSPSWSNPAPSPWTSGSSHNRPYSASASSAGARQPELHRPGIESFIVDADVFKYAKKLRQKDIVMIVENHNVRLTVDEVGDSVNITLQGRSATTAMSKLQSLLNDLAVSLRTQEVPRQDLDRDGTALLEKIRRNGNVYNSVLVCETKHGLHLIGPSSESYEVKQRLQGGAGRAGRMAERTSGRRSSSLPPINRQSSSSYSSPAGAAGYSPLNYQDYAQEGAKPYQGQIGAPRNQSYTLPHHAHRGGTGNQPKPPSIKQPLVNSSIKIRQTIRNLRK